MGKQCGLKYYECKNTEVTDMKRRRMITVCFLLALVTASCGRTTEEKAAGVQKEDSRTLFEESVEIAEKYRDIYETAEKKESVGTLETTKQIVKRLGKEGYAVFDYANQINMENPDKVRAFAVRVEEKKTAGVTILAVNDRGGFTRYDMKTSKGSVDVEKSSLYWDGNTPVSEYREEYTTGTWIYNEKGYLFFERNRLTGTGGGRIAVRLEPLDDTCRELNRNYLIPVGYAQNNMFTEDWSETEYKELNFYDLYERLYRLKTGEAAPYEFAFTGRTYEVPAAQFEDIFQTYFRIDSRTLRQKTNFNEADGTYRYRPRGLYDKGTTPDVPFPEVTAYEEKADGTVKLTVNAVWPKKSMEKAFSHEVVVRPLEDGTYEYVSNHVIPSDENAAPEWYMDRLTDEQWQEYYESTQ
ncbi:hypothetical protein CLOHYLEM_04852 [[Clostridium] hylemonae DSM 15053]|uniref:Uncharacterized protein n=2 Tax=[Clostridium] hylemonae TaxID=89153 RepID=C0BYG3_9FIRM|nr:DUF6070 family protein [[Clostridium] hylemonae]EEG74891.1 hypothetical protein CLOHYLEM_04852 [[Clostridium] hylemonae DSM 15053]